MSMNIEAIAEKVVPTLIVALIFAVFALFQTVESNKSDIVQLKKDTSKQFEYVVKTHNAVIRLESTYLPKVEYYKDKK